MSSFSMINELTSVREQKLKEVANLVTLEEAERSPSFTDPITLYNIWSQLPGDVPHFSNVKASNFSTKLLPSMYILDVVQIDDPENKSGDIDLRFRLFGTANRDHYGKEATGARLSKSAAEGKDEGVANGFEIARLAYHSRQAKFLNCVFYKGNEAVRIASFVVLPLSDDNGNINRLFGCSTWT